MTPAGWGFDQIVMLGVLWMFGGAGLVALVAAMVGRRVPAERRYGAAMLAWGLGNLAVATLGGAYLRLDTVVLTLVPTRCENAAVGPAQPMSHTLVHTLQRPGEPVHDVVLPAQPGDCPATLEPQQLRLRRDALAGSARAVHPEPPVDGDPLLIVVAWGGFGLFGLLFASGMLSQAGHPQPAPAVAAWRRSIGTLIAQLGGLALLAAVVIPFVLPGSTARGMQFGLRAGAAAMACFVLSNGLLGSLRPWRLLILLVAGGALLGMAEVLRTGS